MSYSAATVYLTFDDGTDIYFARQLINERLGAVELPIGTERPQMGPVATGLGEVFHYVMTIGGNDLTKMSATPDSTQSVIQPIPVGTASPR